MPRSIRLPMGIALLALATVAGSPARADDVQVCSSDTATPDNVIRACTGLMRARKLAGQHLENTLWRRGIAYVKKGDIDSAIQDADGMIRAAPASATAFEYRAQNWIRKGDLERAKRDADDAVRLGPKIAGLYNTRGLTHQLLGQSDAAMADFDQAIRLNPKQPHYFSGRASSWQSKGEYTRALTDLAQAIKLDPKEASYYANRGSVYREMGDFDRAMTEFDQVTRMSPRMAPPFAGRGMIWRARADFDKAIAEFDQAIERDPNFMGARVGRGLAQESKGNTELAKQDFRQALSMKITAEARGSAVGSVYLLGDRFKGIAEARLKVLETTPVTPSATPIAPVPAASIKERRIALVIGNGAYTGASKLTNPANDAASIAKALRGIGFEVSEGLDLDATKMKDTINGFLRAASTASMAVMFYAGHGMQIDGKNYLVPIDARLDSGEAMIASVSDVDTILSGLDDQLRTNIVILDACRDDPTLQKSQTTVASRSVQVRSGLAAQSGLGAGATIGAGTLVAFATAPGQFALDGDGANSPFSAALARHISTPGLEVQQMLTRVRAEVVAATKNKQVPWSNSSLLGEVFLVGSR